MPFGDTSLSDSWPYTYKYAYNHLGRNTLTIMAYRWWETSGGMLTKFTFSIVNNVREVGRRISNSLETNCSSPLHPRSLRFCLGNISFPHISLFDCRHFNTAWSDRFLGNEQILFVKYAETGHRSYAQFVWWAVISLPMDLLVPALFTSELHWLSVNSFRKRGRGSLKGDHILCQSPALCFQSQ